MTTARSMLTGQHILEVLEALQAIQALDINHITPEQLGRAKALCGNAAITLRVWSGIEQVAIPVVEAA